MSLTISYRGKLRDPGVTEILLGDVFDLCMEMGWYYMPVHRSNVMPAKGILITPQGCETIVLAFLENGVLYDPFHYIYTEHPEREVLREDPNQWIHVKTRYAGVDTHIAIIKMMRYLSTRYFESFELLDPSRYWDTGNVADCFEHFGEFVNPFNDEEDLMEDEDHEASASGKMDEALWNRGAPEISLN